MHFCGAFENERRCVRPSPAARDSPTRAMETTAHEQLHTRGMSNLAQTQALVLAAKLRHQSTGGNGVLDNALHNILAKSSTMNFFRSMQSEDKRRLASDLGPTNLRSLFSDA
mmetsp:Transcript_22875/g.54189  ORF Transcript_22875/g.54189 Transcript_22875/m.54189 type:complete len:112 (+) Transcript_22875:67-402(+)